MINLKAICYSAFIILFAHLSISQAAEKEQLVDPLQTSPATTQPQLEINVFNLINQARIANLLPALSWSEVIAQQSRAHSLNMANGIVPFGHQGADARYAALRAAIASLTRFGENVAYNFGFSNPAQTAVNGWLNSPGHYANIMGNFTITGVGVAKNLRGEYYFTQIFGKTGSALAFDDEANVQTNFDACETVGDAPVQFGSE